MPDAGNPAHDREPDAADRLALASLPKRKALLAPHMAGELEGGALSPDDAAKCKEALKAFLDGVEAVKTALCVASAALAKLAPADSWIATTENCKKVSNAFVAHARTLTS